MELTYDNVPTSKDCTHCKRRARWWLHNGRRTYNLCDEHFGISLRRVAKLKRLWLKTQSPTVTADVDI